MTREDITLAILACGRRSPSNKWTSVALKIGLLAEHFLEEPPKGLFPMGYHTLSYEGDMEQHMKLKRLVESVL